MCFCPVWAILACSYAAGMGRPIVQGAHMFRLAYAHLLIMTLGLVFSACSATADPQVGDTSIWQDTTTVQSDTPVTSADSSTTMPSDSTAPSGQLAINEVVTSPVDGGTDWIELVVVGSTEVSLAEYTLVDDHDEHAPSSLPDVLLAPGEFYMIKAMSADTETTEAFLPFKLGNSDGLWLSRNGALVDSVEWPKDSAPEGTSYGRLPDGTGAFTTLKPTPGAANEALDEGTVPCTDPFVTNKVLQIEIELTPEAWEAIKNAPQAEEYHEATFIYEGQRVENVGFRTKGNSSLNSAAKGNSIRFPFKVDFNRFVDGQSFCGLKKLAFNNGFKDPSFMREHLAYRLAREIGLPASRTAFIDLTVGGQHIGLYTMVEPVDDDFFLEANFGNDNGDLYKPDWPDGTLQWKGSNYEDYDGLSIENNADSSDHSAFSALVQTINSNPAGDVTKVLDVNAMLKYTAFNTALVNLDSYTGNGHNYYIYEDDDVFTIIPWDLNEAFGNFTCGCNQNDVLGFLVDEPTCGNLADKPLLDILLQNPDYLTAYHGYLEELLEGPFTEANMTSWITEAADLIRPYVKADPTKSYSDEDFEAALTSGGSGGGNAIGLDTFVASRTASMKKQLAGTENSTNGGKGNCSQGGGPGPGDPGGNNPKCPDDICDAFEQANPEVCPEDCD